MASKYRILIVDDSQNEIKQLINKLEKNKEYDISYVDSKNKAEIKLKNNHFHIALIDVHLAKKEPPYNDTSGIKILSDLKRKKPSCYRVLITDYLKEYREEVFDSINPIHRTAQNVLNKKVSSATFIEQINQLIRDNILLNLNLKIEYDRGVLNKLEDKLSNPDLNKLIFSQEIDYLFRRAFADFIEAGEDVEFIIEKVKCEELAEGRSRSIVFKVIPSKENHTYNNVVMKIGSVEDTKNEYKNYIKWIKWFKEYHNRTELLGYFRADNIAGLLYSFAGGSKSEYYSIANILSKKAFLNWTYENYENLVCDLFDPDPNKKEFYSDTWISKADSLKDFYYRSYFINNFPKYQKIFEMWANKSKVCKIDTTTGNIVIEGKGSFKNPYDYISGFRTIGEYYQSICHGDMTVNNILTDDKGKYVVIDFAKTGLGPIELDFVTLEASLRLYLLYNQDNFIKLS
jgi:thiamine kinase-like enzyme/DNA-binding NarL/FixJ family response regulator